ncbi:MAG: questin oxidase family protein [Rhizomicrobium sp.]
MTSHKDYSQMDRALRFLSSYGPDLSNGFTNHAPMVSEALAAMGRADAVMPWIEKNWPLRGLMMPRQKPSHAIGEWKAALGNNAPFDWAAFLAGDLARSHWKDFTARWTARLAPGACSDAAHGIIRAGHAVRSLAEHETPERMQELADAFGLWASSYTTLPAADYAGVPVQAREAIALVPFSPGKAREERGGFTTGLRSLNDFPGFAPVIGMLDVDGDPARILSELTETFARVDLANAHDAYTVIAFIHSVTALAALRTLAQYLDAQTARAGLRHGWQTAAALYSVYGTARPDFGKVAQPQETPYRLIALAVDTGDDHAIKFTEVALREYALNPNPVYLAAARHAIGVLGRHG